LERVGYASAEKLSERETARIIMEDYATAAAHNRSINLSTQAKMVWANKVVLWITLALIAESLMFVILVGA